MLRRILAKSSTYLFYESDLNRRLGIRKGAPPGSLFRLQEQGLSFNFRNIPPDTQLIKQILFDKCYEVSYFAQHDKIQIIHDLIVKSQNIPLIVDLGANIGLASLWFHKKYPLSKIIALEPQIDNYELGHLNTSIVSNISYRRLAIGGSTGTLKLYDTGHGEWGYTTLQRDCNWGAIDDVEVITIRQLVEEDPQYRPLILKVDIEGAEIDIFEDHEILNRFPLIIVEVHDWMHPWGRTSDSLMRLMGGCGFDFLIKGENVLLFNRSSDLLNT